MGINIKKIIKYIIVALTQYLYFLDLSTKKIADPRSSVVINKNNYNTINLL